MPTPISSSPMVTTKPLRPWRIKDIKGRRFGRLVALEFVGIAHGAVWACKCDCGSTRIIPSRSLLAGCTNSCGCYQKECCSKRGKSTFVHGLSGSKGYGAWANMLSRCSNSRCREYRLYGGRGIKVCEEWKKFANFHKDMGEPEHKDLSLDRIDNNKGYFKENCRWATKKEQGRNTSRVDVVYFRGERILAIELAERYGVNYRTFRDRKRKGRTLEECLSKNRLPSMVKVIKVA